MPHSCTVSIRRSGVFPKVIHQRTDNGLAQPPGRRRSSVQALDKCFTKCIDTTGNELVACAPTSRSREEVQNHPGSQPVRGRFWNWTNPIGVSAVNSRF